METLSLPVTDAVLTVSELSFRLKSAVETQFAQVQVRGEVSGLMRASSGHVYCAIKDANAVLDGVCWRGNASRLRAPFENGVEVIARGKLSTYPGRSKYQLIIESAEPAGVGALMALLEKRRKALQAEGLFDPARKRPLPLLPQVIGIVTSPTGAVIRDILHRLADRFPRHVLLWPVMVQGEGAAAQIAAAIEGFNALPEGGAIPRPDVLIVARGGGSIEDLWAFNEEIVVRAAANSRIPLISAVGHETDTTLVDFASDLRAPTPTAAAEMVVPVREDMLYTVHQHQHRMRQAMLRAIQMRRERVEGLSRGLPKPQQLLALAWQRSDEWGSRIQRAMQWRLSQQRERLAGFAPSLQPQRMERNLLLQRERLDAHALRLQQAAQRGGAQATLRLSQTGALLESYHYTKVLQRGFALVKHPDGGVIPSRQAFLASPNAVLEFADGEVVIKA
jgi:exodeoxyribonuclease VII large subunit